MNFLKLQKCARDRDEHRSVSPQIQALVLAHARHNGLTHEEPSSDDERAYRELLHATSVVALRGLKLPHAEQLRADREQVPPEEHMAKAVAVKKRRREREHSR